MTARSCQRCRSAIEPGDLRCAVCGQAVPIESVRRHEVNVQILRCNGCDAAVAYDPTVQAPRCAFCDEIMHVSEVEDPMEQTEHFLPFSVELEQAKGSVRGWLGTLGWFRPSDLRSASRVESVKPLYWVGWICNAEAQVSWTADSDYDAQRSAWAPHSGQTMMSFDNLLVSASKGLSAEESRYLTSSYQLATKRDGPEGASSPIVEQFDVQRSVARGEIMEQLTRTAQVRVAERHVPGTAYREVHVAPLLRELTTRRYAFPTYVMAYRYGGEAYRAVVSGQDASYVTGTAPLSWPKILAVVAAGVAIIAAIVFAILG